MILITIIIALTTGAIGLLLGAILAGGKRAELEAQNTLLRHENHHLKTQLNKILQNP